MQSDLSTTKFCPRCQTEKPLTEFWIISHQEPRPRHWCKKCLGPTNKIYSDRYRSAKAKQPCQCGCGELTQGTWAHGSHRWHAIPLKERFEKYVQESDGCWPWIGARTGKGYGAFSVPSPSGRPRLMVASRVSYEIYVGPIPPRLFVCHRCDNRECVRPDHLFLGTHQDNMDDKRAKGRESHYGPSFSGEKHPMATLTDAQASEMRTLFDGGGWQQSALAQRFGVSKRVVYGVVRNETFRHLPLCHA